MTPIGIEPAAFRFVAQRPNHRATAAPDRNEYQEYFLVGRCVGLTILQSSCATCLEIWKSHPPGALGACPGITVPLCILVL